MLQPFACVVVCRVCVQSEHIRSSSDGAYSQHNYYQCMTFVCHTNQHQAILSMINIISRACLHTCTVIDCDDSETLMNIEVSMHLARYI